MNLYLSALKSVEVYMYDLKFGRNKMGTMQTMRGEVQDLGGCCLGPSGDL